jgi:hypothetical protein
MKSIIDRHRAVSVHGHQDISATAVSEQSLDALWKRLEVAEATVRSLERENEQLRAERTRAVLDAARATEKSDGSQSPAMNEPESKFEALTKELKIAEAARAEAARERQTAIEAVREALKAEYAQRIAVIQEKHADELAALSAMAEKQAREAVAKELDALASEVSDTQRALVSAKRERETDLRALEENLGKKYGEEIEALHRHYATTLERLSKQKKEQFASELVSSLSSAHASWQQDTAKQLRRATETAAKAIKDERARWQRRQKRTLRRAAHVWRRRERSRLLAARAQWKSAQRRAIDACNARWQLKFDRLRKQASLISVCSQVSAGVWARMKSLTSSLTPQRTPDIGGTGFRSDPAQPTRLQAALMAALLIFLGVNFSLTAGLPTSSDGPASAAPAEASPSAPQIASVPVNNSGEPQAAESVSARQIQSGRSSSGRGVASPNPAVNRTRSPSEESAGHGAAMTRTLEQRPVRQTVVRPDKRMTEKMIRERLRENIRNLRMGRTAN